MPSSNSNARAEAWRALEAYAARVQGGLKTGACTADERDGAMVREACGLYLDCSRQRVDLEGLNLLEALARACDLEGWRDRMYRGEAVNQTEDRAALHVALRTPAGADAPAGGNDVLAEVETVRERMGRFSTQVRNGTWRGFDGQRIRHLVNIGIGGSDLGPAMVCRALDHLGHEEMTCHFVSNLDSNELAGVLEACDPAATLFLIASKTFSTQETLTNARSARAWLVAAAGGDEFRGGNAFRCAFHGVGPLRRLRHSRGQCLWILGLGGGTVFPVVRHWAIHCNLSGHGCVP